MFGVSLPPSFEQARRYAEWPNHRHRYCQRLVPTQPLSADVKPDEQAQTQAALNELAKWPRLRNALLPEPVVGGLEADPAGTIDRLGAKGLSGYTAFIDMEDLRCRICGQVSDTIEIAILHQRHVRHFRA